MKIAILGAGAVALSSAALVTKNGHRACLWSAIPSEVELLRSKGLVTCEGDCSGTFPIDVAAEVQECLTGADVVMIAAPAFAHRTLMSACAPHILPDQVVVMNTATGFSSLYFARVLANRNVRPTIVDLATTVCMARVSGPHRVRLGPLKPDVDLATIPAAHGEVGRAVLTKMFGNFFVVRKSALSISLNNHNPIYHIPALIFNLPLVERGEDWNVWRNMTPFAARYMSRLDNERMAVANCFNVSPIPLAAYVRSSLGVEGDNLGALFAAAAQKRPAPTGPKILEDRYMTEDMPYGMVFFRTLGQVGRVRMPLTDHLIEFCCDLYCRDFRTEAPGLDELDLPNASRADIIHVARYGF